MLTIREHKKTLDGPIRVVIVGDIAHSRVVRSNIYLMNTLGFQVTVVGPSTMIPIDMEKLGVQVSNNLEEAIQDTDVIMMLRIQMERQNKNLLSSLREYSNYFCLTKERLKRASKDVLVIHPGPVNRGIEIALDVMQGPHSMILDQVTNGIAIRMALMYLLIGGSNESMD
jgi:aspartate carbamoyltransferase catalytic subunit